MALSTEELRFVASHILKPPKFWVPLCFGLVGAAWLALELVDYATGRKVQDVVDGIHSKVSNALAEANTRMTNEISQGFQEPRIQSLMENVVTKRALARVDETADKVIDEKIRIQISPRLEKTDSQLQKAADAVSRLDKLSEFYELATRLRSDDRKAFDSIMRMTGNPSDPRFAQACAVINDLPKEVEILNLLEYPVDWKALNIDPGTADISTLTMAMQKLQPIFQTKVMDTVWSTERFSKRDRIQFILDNMVNTSSLRCLDKGCRLLGGESSLNKNFLAWQEYPRWWESHKQNYK